MSFLKFKGVGCESNGDRPRAPAAAMLKDRYYIRTPHRHVTREELFNDM